MTLLLDLIWPRYKFFVTNRGDGFKRLSSSIRPSSGIRGDADAEEEVPEIEVVCNEAIGQFIWYPAIFQHWIDKNKSTRPPPPPPPPSPPPPPVPPPPSEVLTSEVTFSASKYFIVIKSYSISSGWLRAAIAINGRHVKSAKIFYF